MEIVRCPKCERMLGKVQGKFELKCCRCGKVVEGITVLVQPLVGCDGWL